MDGQQADRPQTGNAQEMDQRKQDPRQIQSSEVNHSPSHDDSGDAQELKHQKSEQKEKQAILLKAENFPGEGGRSLIPTQEQHAAERRAAPR